VSSPDVSAAEPSSEPAQEETATSPAITASAESSAVEEAVSEESEAQIFPEPVVTEAEAQNIESVPDPVESTEADIQTPGENIEAADAPVEQTTALDKCVTEEPVEAENLEPDPSPETQEELVDSPQQSNHDAEDIASDDIEAVETPEQPSVNPSSTEPADGDTSQESQPSEDIPEESSTTLETASSTTAVPPESGETGTVEVPTESENTPDSPPIEHSEDPNEIVQIIDIGDDGSTDDTAAIVVPPPPPPGPHVTIAEPVKPPKPSKRKSSSSRSSKSRSVEKRKEKPVMIIQLREAKSKTVARAKGRGQKGKSRKGGEIERGELLPPPPPMIVDVPPRAPSPPPSGLVIEVVEDEEVLVVDPSVGKEDDHAADIVVPALEAESEVIEVVEAEGDPVVAVLDQEDESVDTKDQEEHAAPADIPPPPEADVSASSLDDGAEEEGAENFTGVDEKPQLADEETTSQPETNLVSSGDPPVDSPSKDRPPPEDSLHDESNLAEPATTGPEAHDAVITEEQTKSIVMAESAVEGASEAGSSPVLESGPSADGEPEIVETDPVSERTGDVAVPNAVPAETDVSTMEVDTLGERSDFISEAAVSGDHDLPEEAVVVVLPDEEDAIDVPPEAPMPPETAALNAGSELNGENEASKHQTSEDATEKAMDEDIQPESSLEVVVHELERAPPEEHSESKPEDHSEDIAPEHREEADISDDAVVDELASSLDSDVSPPEADVSVPSDDANVHKEDDENGADLVEGAIEPSETVTAALEEQNTAILYASETSENMTTDPPSPVAGKPNAVEMAEAQQKSADQELGHTSIDQVQQINAPMSEEEARVELIDDIGAPDPEAPATKQEGKEVGAAPDSDPAPKDDTETVESAEVLEAAVSAEACAEAEEVMIQHVIDDVEKPAGKETVDQEPAADEAENVIAPDLGSEQVDKASEPRVVESADSESRGTPEESVSTDSTESHDPGNISAQPIEPKFESIPEQAAETAADPISNTDDATPSTAGDSAQTEDQVSPELSVPVLAEEAQIVEVVEVVEATQATAENLPESGVGETTKVAELVDTAPLLEETPESDETSSPGQQPILPAEEKPEPPAEEPSISPVEKDGIELHRLAGAEPTEPTVPADPVEPDKAVEPEPLGEEPVTEAEILPEDSISQQSRCETLPDSEPGRKSPLIEEPTIVQPTPVETGQPPPSKHSAKVSFDEPTGSSKVEEPVSPPKERRKSSKSSSHRHSSSRHKVRDVSSPQPDQKSATPPTQSRRRSSTAKAPPSGLFRSPSTTKPRSRAEAAEQAEIRRRAAELADREQEVQRQLERARRRAALEEKERQLREKEEELARLTAVEREQKRARREDQRRREQEALEQERAIREKAEEEEARQKELERAERRRRRDEAGTSGGRRHRDEHPRVRRHSTSHRQPEVRDLSPTPEPKLSRHRTEDIGAERQRSRDEYYIREVPPSPKNPEERRHRRSSRRDSERNEKPKKGFWKSILGKI
jgi:hypothetical protein